MVTPSRCTLECSFSQDSSEASGDDVAYVRSSSWLLGVVFRLISFTVYSCLWRRLPQCSDDKSVVTLYTRGHVVPAGTRSLAKDHVGRLRACSKNVISMINVFTLPNVNTKIIEGELRKIFVSEVYMKLVALRINWYIRSSSQFQKGK